MYVLGAHKNRLIETSFEPFLISPEKTNSKTNKVNQQDRIIAFNSVTLKKHRQILKNILFFSTQQKNFRVGG